ncbi:tetratricopeptide repeat protein [Peteryoungia desertarenae]|uniref:Tetratricopeptide repeat protein n=1 Tax=Peteryoungia desertarenae TaxID=1813451 RepID=A0ABX6QL84_9HYPH|nr:tetratricopeptide repeat protein [Peteryoungia desertarenae]QLF69091.1 tetratricopeptide repeat protein [Peteryoungia desertarenae]
MVIRNIAPARLSRLTVGICLISAALVVSGCSTSRSNKPLTTGSIPRAATNLESMSAPELARAADSIGQAYERNPKDRDVGLSYARVLMMTGRNTQAHAVMQQVAIAHPTDREVLASLGKTQAAAGQLEQALSTIRRAQTPDRPDWKLYSAEGAVLDQLGRSAEARARYRMALDMQPNDPSVLSNLGMSHVLSGDLKTAETFLRTASQQPGADSRVRQNLALVVGLQGRFQEAEQIARQELNPQQAEANLDYLRSMLSQQNSWKKLAAKDDKTKKTN